MKDPAVVGIDLGGTNVRLALISSQGTILSRWERATASMPDQVALVSTLAADIAIAGEEARSQGWEVKGVGIGVPGLIHPQEGLVVFAPNVPALNECPLVPLLAPQVNWPLFLENDANLFTLGEHWLGAGVGHDHMLGITLGTGVGGGLGIVLAAAGWSLWPLSLSLPLVMWARLRLQAHTPAQVWAGAILGGAASSLLLSLFFNT